MRESDLRRHLINEISDGRQEAGGRPPGRSALQADRRELKAKGIKDFQLYYAIETLRRTAPPALAQRK
jgi:carboxyl-terminal processing protease